MYDGKKKIMLKRNIVEEKEQRIRCNHAEKLTNECCQYSIQYGG